MKTVFIILFTTFIFTLNSRVCAEGDHQRNAHKHENKEDHKPHHVKDDHIHHKEEDSEHQEDHDHANEKSEENTQGDN